MFILFTLVCVAFQLMATNNSTQEIKGRIVDKNTGTPLEGVAVSVTDPDIPIGTISDENGEFRLWDIPVNMRVRVSLDGYQAAYIDISGKVISDDSPFVVELENRAKAKKKFSIGSIFKSRKPDLDLVVFASE